MTGFAKSVAVTRPADTTAYSAGDVIGAATGSTAALQFAGVGGENQDIRITTVSLEVDDTALIASEAAYTLHLYSQLPPSALGDNGAFDVPAGDRPYYLGSFSLGTPIDLGSTLYVENVNINKQLRLAGSSLFAYLVTAAGYTPSASRVYKIKLHTVVL